MTPIVLYYLVTICVATTPCDDQAMRFQGRQARTGSFAGMVDMHGYGALTLQECLQKFPFDDGSHRSFCVPTADGGRKTLEP